MSTQYEENERELSMANVGRLGLNPFAVKLLVESYKNGMYPVPVELMALHNEEDPIQDGKAPTKGLVEIHLRKPGYLGKKKSKTLEGIDKFGVKLLAQSYYYNLRPRPISFFFRGVEVHIRTPKIEEKRFKNVARNIWNPTLNKYGKVEL
jgi:hypothetical protein